MKPFIPAFIFGLILFLEHAFAQDYVNKHYTRANGLAGNMVYCATQDRDGFIWFGTENGASRFDGKNFVNFTTNDGLTDNEVLEMYADLKGRVWFICFTGPLCYYYKGKIYNPSSDTLLDPRYIPSRARMRGFFQSRDSTMWFLSQKPWKYTNHNAVMKAFPDSNLDALYGFFIPEGKKDAEFVIFDNEKFKPFKAEDRQMVVRVSPFPIDSAKFLKLTSDYSSKFIQGRPGLFYLHFKNSVASFRITEKEISMIKMIDVKYNINRLNKTGASDQIWLSTHNGGAILLDDSLDIAEQRFADQKISFTLIDRNENCWHTTLGNGVFMVHHSKARVFKKPEIFSSEIFSLSKINNELVLGYENGIVQHIVNGKIMPAKQFFHSAETGNSVKGALKAGGGNIFYFTGKTIMREGKHGERKAYRAANSIKDLAIFNDTTVISASHNGAFIIFPSCRIDTLLVGRTTSIEGPGPDRLYFIASIDTLYQYSGTSVVRAVPAYDSRRFGKVSDMCYSSQRILFISTYNAGIVSINGESTLSVTEADGLLSNQCRKLFMENDSVIWVISNLGFSKLLFTGSGAIKNIQNYSSSDGFTSDNISGLCLLNDTIWLATDQGLNFFTESNINPEPDHSVQITSFTVNNSKVGFYDNRIRIRKNANIQITFSGITISSADKLTYKYKLSGADNKWISTSSNEIELPSVPAGSYELTVYSIDKNNRQSPEASVVSFEVLPAVWETWWFRTAATAIVLVFLYLLFRNRVRKIRHAEKEKTKINKQFAELKLEAVRSQMDPHFIFNCLNAIQHFNIREDYKSAQYFISEFAKLIRKTLNHSRRDFILLVDEIELLEVYIKLEKLRFEDLIDYSIKIADEIRPQVNELVVPSLIFQPYLENAINHGLKYLTLGNGKILLSVDIRDNRLFVSLDDNGIGILESKKISHQEKKKNVSYGISLNDSHIEVINKIHDMDITCTITDKSTRLPKQQGTIVEISLPLRYKTESIYV